MPSQLITPDDSLGLTSGEGQTGGLFGRQHASGAESQCTSRDAVLGEACMNVGGLFNA